MTVRWAVLGTGFISNTVTEAIKASPGSSVDLVAGRSAQNVEAFQRTHSIPRSVSDYESAATDAEVDAVYIATPNHAHHDLAIAAAGAGKAILSEKSLTTTMETAGSLVDAVRDRVFFVEGLMYLAHPVLSRFTELLIDPRVGQVREIHASYAADIAAVVNPLGRGTIYNLGCYPVSLLHLVIQTACGSEVFADREMSANGTLTAEGTIGAAVASVRFSNDVLATVASTDNYGMSHSFRVLTDLGELRFETNPWLPAAGDNVISWTPYDGEAEKVVVTDGHDAFFHQIAMVERGVAAGKTEAERPSPRLDDSLEIMDFLTTWEQLCLSP